MKPWDPDYGLTFEERIERRLKEAQEKEHEARKRVVKARSFMESNAEEIIRLEKLLSKGQ